jgi:hypothetical protein
MQKYYHEKRLLLIQENMMGKENTRSQKSLKINKLNHANEKGNPVEKRSTLSTRVIPKTREELIAERAYLKSLSRKFQGNDCLKDWLEAEAEIDSQIEHGFLESYEGWDDVYCVTEDPRFCG